MFTGHSIGGLFAVFAFYERPALFQSVLAVSPSLWWHEHKMVAEAEAYLKANPEMKRSLYVALGADEDEDMRKGFDALQAVLKSHAPKGLTWQARVFENEDHGSIVLPAHYHGLTFLFSFMKPKPGIFDRGIKGLDEHYQSVSKRLGYTVNPPEMIINAMGYQLLMSGQKEPALEIFARNVRLYPGSANVHDSYGEALEGLDRLEEASKSYARALEIARANGAGSVSLIEKNLKRVEEKLSKK